MRISTKARYGLRAMLDLAIYAGVERIPLKTIAERQDLSVSYLESIFSALRKKGLVKSIKGMQGGYILGDAPSNITLSMILQTLEGDLSIIDAKEDVHSLVDRFLNDTVWDKVNTQIYEITDTITLEDLVSEYRRINGESALMYYI